MEADCTKEILRLTLEIIQLLTGEDYIVVKKTSSGERDSITELPDSLLIPNNDKRILEATKKMIGLLTGEVPKRCQDVAVYFSMEEWEYLEGHKDLYKDIMMEDQPPLTSPGGHDGWNTSKGGNEDDVAQYTPRLNLVTQYIHHKLDHMVRTTDLLNCEEIGCPSTDGSPRPSHVEELASNRLDPSTKTDNKTFPCSECGKLFSSISSLSGHQRTHAGKGPFFCLECGKGFTRKRALVFHHSCHTNEGPFACLYCSKPFMKKYDLLLHQKMHIRKPVISCSVCKKSFKNKQEFVQHQATHRTDKPPASSEFKENKQETYVGSDPRTLPEGEIITTTVEGPLSLDRATGGHEGGKTPERPQDSNKRNNGIAQSSPGVNHGTQFVHPRHMAVTTEQTHSAESIDKSHTNIPGGSVDPSKPEEPSSNNSDALAKKFSCSECGKCFTSASSLGGHQRTHAGKGPFFCLECGKGFTRKRALVFHQSSHTIDGPFPCPYCDKPFMKKHDLIVHQKMHIRKPVFPCFHCKKSYRSKQDLVQHQRTHDPNPPYLYSEAMEKKEGTHVRGDQLSMQEGKVLATRIKDEHFQDISTGGQDGYNSQEGHSMLSSNYNKEDNSIVRYSSGASLTTQNLHHRPDHTVASEDPLHSNDKLHLIITNVQSKFHMPDGPPRRSYAENSSHKYLAKDINKDNTFSCSECGKCFNSISSLSGHHRTHTGKGPFFCLQCGKGFTRKRALVLHQSSHTDKGKFPCQECDKRFMTKHDLVLHQKTHKLQPAVSSSKCKESFKNEQHLEEHQINHSSEKTFLCSEVKKEEEDYMDYMEEDYNQLSIQEGGVFTIIKVEPEVDSLTGKH